MSRVSQQPVIVVSPEQHTHAITIASHFEPLVRGHGGLDKLRQIRSGLGQGQGGHVQNSSASRRRGECTARAVWYTRSRTTTELHHILRPACLGEARKLQNVVQFRARVPKAESTDLRLLRGPIREPWLRRPRSPDARYALARTGLPAHPSGAARYGGHRWIRAKAPDVRTSRRPPG